MPGIKQKRITSKMIVDGELTEQQVNFCVAYVMMTDFDAVEAIKLTDFSFGAAKDELLLTLQRKAARRLLANPKVKDRIKQLVDERDCQVVIDKFFVKNGLKTLAQTAENENTKVKAFELLGKELGMFVNKDELKITEDPGEIAKLAFKRRLELKVLNNKEEEETNEARVC